MKVEVQAPDVEQLVKDYLQEVMFDVDCTIGIGVPSGWTKTSTPHLEVASDGAPFADWPLFIHETIRLVARAGSTSEAKELCARGQGWLLAHNGNADISQTRFLSGVIPARDAQTGAELAFCTSRVSVRTEPLAIGS